jgi:hypothetical protein
MAVEHLSEHVLEQVRCERPVIEARIAELREQSRRLHALTDRLDQELDEALRVLRGIEEMLGEAPQLSLDAFNGEIRGRRLREIAVELLRQRRTPDDVIHYREWYDLLVAAGVRVAGKDPLATFLTQINQAPEVASVKPRSGLYRLAS